MKYDSSRTADRFDNASSRCHWTKPRLSRRPVLWGLLSCLLFAALESFAADGPAKHVVLISVDGLPAYLFDDPNVPMTTIRELAAAGVVAEGMTVSNPSVTWPNHTSLVTGVRPVDHGVLFNGVLERGSEGLPARVNSKADKAELVHVSTIFDAAKRQGLTTAGINWPCTRNSGTLDVDLPDAPEALDHTTPALLESLKASGDVTEAELQQFSKLSPIARDRIWTKAACHVIRTRKPNLLLFHLLNLDAVHHRYGPQTWAGYSAVAYADRCVRDVLDALEEAGIREQTTVLVVADHGFIAIPKTLQPNVLLRQAGLLTVEGNRIATAEVMTIPEGGVSMLYFTRRETAAANRQKVLELFANQEGLETIVTPDRYAGFGLPQPDEYPQMADLVLAAKDGYGFAAGATGEEFVTASTSLLGTHGFLSTNPRMNATFVISGAGVRRGGKIGMIENIQVAPTIASLLGIPFDSTQAEPPDVLADK